MQCHVLSKLLAGTESAHARAARVSRWLIVHDRVTHQVLQFGERFVADVTLHGSLTAVLEQVHAQRLPAVERRAADVTQVVAMSRVQLLVTRQRGDVAEHAATQLALVLLPRHVMRQHVRLTVRSYTERLVTH